MLFTIVQTLWFAPQARKKLRYMANYSFNPLFRNTSETILPKQCLRMLTCNVNSLCYHGISHCLDALLEYEYSTAVKMTCIQSKTYQKHT